MWLSPEREPCHFGLGEVRGGLCACHGDVDKDTQHSRYYAGTRALAACHIHKKKTQMLPLQQCKTTWTRGGGAECWLLSLENVFHVPHNFFIGENMFVECLLEVIPLLHLKIFGSLSLGRWGILVLGLGS